MSTGQPANLRVLDIDEQTATMAPGLPNRILGQANESVLKLSVFQGDGNWHAHPKTDEIFVVLEGEMFLDIWHGETVALGPRQVTTIPAGVVHRPRSKARSTILCFKPAVSETQFYEVDSGVSKETVGSAR